MIDFPNLRLRHANAIPSLSVARIYPAPVNSAWMSRRRCRGPRQKVRFQASILPVSEAALSLTRNFQVPFAASEEAFTV